MVWALLGKIVSGCTSPRKVSFWSKELLETLGSIKKYGNHLKIHLRVLTCIVEGLI